VSFVLFVAIHPFAFIQHMNSPIYFLPIVVSGTAAVFFVAWAVSRAMRWTKTRPRSFSGAAWALLFFTSGRMPPPPPQTQIEQETNAKKNRENGQGDVDESR
jgi:H+/gluconate symporter-like permease